MLAHSVQRCARGWEAHSVLCRDGAWELEREQSSGSVLALVVLHACSDAHSAGKTVVQSVRTTAAPKVGNWAVRWDGDSADRSVVPKVQRWVVYWAEKLAAHLAAKWVAPLADKKALARPACEVLTRAGHSAECWAALLAQTKAELRAVPTVAASVVQWADCSADRLALHWAGWMAASRAVLTAGCLAHWWAARSGSQQVDR